MGEAFLVYGGFEKYYYEDGILVSDHALLITPNSFNNLLPTSVAKGYPAGAFVRATLSASGDMYIANYGLSDMVFRKFSRSNLSATLTSVGSKKVFTPDDNNLDGRFEFYVEWGEGLLKCGLRGTSPYSANTFSIKEVNSGKFTMKVYYKT